MKVLHSSLFLPLALLAAIAGCQRSGALLGPDAPQGVEGRALLGPTCPVQPADSTTCQDQPYQASVTVLEANGSEVTRFRTGTDGSFRVGLEPGTYTLHPQSGNPFPHATDQSVTVAPGAYTSVTILFDTGIR